MPISIYLDQTECIFRLEILSLNFEQTGKKKAGWNNKPVLAMEFKRKVTNYL
jgi:hypothetical protein